MQVELFPRSRALDRAGIRIAASIAMIAITTRSSMSVKLYSFTCLETGEMPSSLQLVSRSMSVKRVFFFIIYLSDVAKYSW